MCPFCISTVISVAAGTVATAGLGTLFAFARRAPKPTSQDVEKDSPTATGQRA